MLEERDWKSKREVFRIDRVILGIELGSCDRQAIALGYPLFQSNDNRNEPQIGLSLSLSLDATWTLFD